MSRLRSMHPSGEYDGEIPWSVSDLPESEIVPASQLTLDQQQAAKRDAETWVSEGIARRDRCNHCGEYYDERNPQCSAASVHERYAGEIEAKQVEHSKRRNMEAA